MLPRHVAIIMDGNGRWAERQSKRRFFGHNEGVNALKRTVKHSVERKIEFLTVYAFSSENWSRPKTELNFLFTLFEKTLSDQIEELHDNNIEFHVIGDISAMPTSLQKALKKGIEKTKYNTGLTLTIALNYGSQSEIVRATKAIANEVRTNQFSLDDITTELIEKYLYTSHLPPVDLLIRTSGEKRISNFLLWQVAYAEMYFSDVYWPDFCAKELDNALNDFAERERRFGNIKEISTWSKT